MYTTQTEPRDDANVVIWWFTSDALEAITEPNTEIFIPNLIWTIYSKPIWVTMEVYDRDVAKNETAHLCGEAGGFELHKTEPHEPPYHCQNDKHGCDAELCHCSCGMCADFPDDLTDEQAATLADNERMGVAESIETEIKEQVSDEWRIIQREKMDERGEQ